MGPEGGDAVFSADLFQHRERLTGADDDGQSTAEVKEALGHEVPMAGIGVGGGPERRFVDIKQENRAPPRRFEKRRVVPVPEVPFEPNDLMHSRTDTSKRTEVAENPPWLR